jgi:hypothetical protein
MKKILTLATAVFLFAGIAGHAEKDKEKGKKKEKTHKTCSGKECGRKKG